jgi:hypothetical protein
MSKHIDAAVKGGLVLSLGATIILAVLHSRQREQIVRLNVQVNELEARECEQVEAEPCSCEADTRLLTACSESLKMARAQITRASKARQLQASQEAGGGVEPGVHDEWSAAAAAAAGSADDVPHQRVRDLFSGKLGIAPEQMQPLGELVCAAMALRQSLLDDYAYGETGEQETWQQLTAARRELTAQMKDVLGPEKYKEFRAAGGIGALAMVIDCDG